MRRNSDENGSIKYIPDLLEHLKNFTRRKRAEKLSLPYSPGSCAVWLLGLDSKWPARQTSIKDTQANTTADENFSWYTPIRNHTSHKGDDRSAIAKFFICNELGQSAL